MIKQLNIIEQLAIRYNAFQTAMTNHDDNGRACWGRMLLETQERLGVNLVDVENTKAIIKTANERLDAREAA